MTDSYTRLSLNNSPGTLSTTNCGVLPPRILFSIRGHLTLPMEQNADVQQFNLNGTTHQAVPLCTHSSMPLAHLSNEIIN